MKEEENHECRMVGKERFETEGKWEMKERMRSGRKRKREVGNEGENEGWKKRVLKI